MKLSVELFRPEIICVVHELSTALQLQPHIYTHSLPKEGWVKGAAPPSAIGVPVRVCV